MRLQDNGIDVFYIDESHDQTSYVVSAVAIPFMRRVDNIWTITWPSHLESAKAFRSLVAAEEKIPRYKELHGTKLISGRGNFLKGKHNFDRAKASGVYRRILRNIDRVVPDASILSAATRRGSRQLYGHSRLKAALYALLQRMRLQCNARGVNAMVFFDQGHPEYRSLYRKAQVYLPTGSSQPGGWEGDRARNMALEMFFKDGNEKNSKHCHFTQIADLVAYSAFLKVKSEHGELEPWQQGYNLGTLYDEIPARVMNTRASNVAPRDGIVMRY